MCVYVYVCVCACVCLCVCVCVCVSARARVRAWLRPHSSGRADACAGVWMRGVVARCLCMRQPLSRPSVSSSFSLSRARACSLSPARCLMRFPVFPPGDESYSKQPSVDQVFEALDSDKNGLLTPAQVLCVCVCARACACACVFCVCACVPVCTRACVRVVCIYHQVSWLIDLRYAYQKSPIKEPSDTPKRPTDIRIPQV